MKITTVSLLLLSSVQGFSPIPVARSTTVLQGYLDDLTKELYAESDNPDIEGSTKEATDMKEEDKDRFGPGDWSTYSDFGDEFDGGDGQMGVAGDGNKGLEKLGNTEQMATSRAMSAKNSWGKSTGYAEVLIEQGVETQRAQQLENWANQQEIRAQKNAQREMAEAYDDVSYEEDWRALAKFGVERNQEFDLDDAFGGVAIGDIDGTIELVSRLNQNSVHEISLKNEFMGFADFRAAFTADTDPDWTVEPKEGNLSKEPTNFLIKFRPSNPGASEGYLVIETEDMKKTYKLIGSTS